MDQVLLFNLVKKEMGVKLPNIALFSLFSVSTVHVRRHAVAKKGKRELRHVVCNQSPRPGRRIYSLRSHTTRLLLTLGRPGGASACGHECQPRTIVYRTQAGITQTNFVLKENCFGSRLR